MHNSLKSQRWSNVSSLSYPKNWIMSFISRYVMVGNWKLSGKIFELMKSSSTSCTRFVEFSQIGLRFLFNTACCCAITFSSTLDSVCSSILVRWLPALLKALASWIVLNFWIKFSKLPRVCAGHPNHIMHLSRENTGVKGSSLNNKLKIHKKKIKKTLDLTSLPSQWKIITRQVRAKHKVHKNKK